MLSYLSGSLCVFGSYLHFFLPTLGEMILEIPTSSAKNQQKTSNYRKTTKTKDWVSCLRILLL